jgi:nitrogenase molybdenum-iron protein alpha/beta subunit
MAGDFEIPLCNHRALFGTFLAAHAIPDAIDIMFAGVGCKAKAQRQIAMHDRGREAGNKMVWADVGDVQLIAGPAERLRNMTVETVRRREGVGLVLITTSAAMEMTGADVEAVLPAIRRDVGCPVVHLPAAGWTGDLYAGYASAVEAVLGLAPWREVRAGDRRSVNVVGYLFDRYERDHAANLAELRRLLAAVGLTLHATFLSGVPLAALRTAPEAGVNLLLPHGPAERTRIASLTGRRTAACALPVGRSMTARFLRESARAAGVPAATVRGAVEAERERTEPALRAAREGLAGRRAAVLANTPLAAGLAALLADLGVTPVLAGLLDRTLGGADAFRASVAPAGVDADGCVVLEDPSGGDLDEACGVLRGREAAAGRPPFDLLIAPDLWLPPSVTDGAARVELGFPSDRRHAVAPSPFLGSAGVVAIAQRLLDAACGVH